MASHDNQIDDLKDQVKQLSERLEKFAGDAEGTAKTFMKAIPDTFKDGMDSAKDAAKRVGGQAQDYAKENPWHVAGIAAAAGFLLAMLARRDRD